MDEIKFNAWIARDRISDDEYDDYPRTFLFDKKPYRLPVWYYTENLSCEWCQENGKLGSYKFKELLPDLKFEDETVEVEVTVKIIKK